MPTLNPTDVQLTGMVDEARTACEKIMTRALDTSYFFAEEIVELIEMTEQVAAFTDGDSRFDEVRAELARRAGEGRLLLERGALSGSTNTMDLALSLWGPLNAAAQRLA